MKIANVETVYEVNVVCEDKNEATELARFCDEDYIVRQEENIVIILIYSDDASSEEEAEWIVEQVLLNKES